MNSELDKLIFVFDVVWERMRHITGWTKYGQLATFLGIKPSSVSGAKQRGFISLEWIYHVAQGYNVSTDWLASGRGVAKRANQASIGNGVIQGDDNEMHIDIQLDHPLRRGADRAMEQLASYGSNPLLTQMLVDFSKLSKAGKLDVLKFTDQVLEREKGAD